MMCYSVEDNLCSFFGNEFYSTGGTAREHHANSVWFRSQQLVWMGEESLRLCNWMRFSLFYMQESKKSIFYYVGDIDEMEIGMLKP